MRFHVYSVLTALFVVALALTALQYVDTEPELPAPRAEERVAPVNAVLGNQSFRVVHGRAPSAQTPERLRLRTHLAYVESLLRQRDVSHLSADQRTNRARLLDALHQYWMRGRFPRNTEAPGRAPVFIDDSGRLCAVAHLISRSAGRESSEAIDEKYHLSLVRDIDAAVLDRWAQRNGFTRRELAMIQPMYCYSCHMGEPENDDASALELTGLTASIGTTILNGALLETGSPSVVGGALGIAGGATSFGVGLTDDAEYPTVSIVAGATSVAVGTWSLLAKLRDDAPQRPTSASTSRRWHVAPSTITTVQGTTRPGLTTTVTF